MAAGTVVWTFRNDRSLWSPYEPHVSNELERYFSFSLASGGPAAVVVDLGALCPKLAGYSVDLLAMKQTRNKQKTKGRIGRARDVQRIVCSPTSALGQGFVWEFEGDSPNSWVIYDLDMMDIIEEAFGNRLQVPVLDLQQSRLTQPYIIDFNAMTQMRVETSKVRHIRRRMLSQAYAAGVSVASQTTAVAAAGLASSSSWPSQQPLANKIQALRSCRRPSPYLLKSGAVPFLNGVHPPYHSTKCGLVPSGNGVVFGPGPTGAAGIQSLVVQQSQVPLLTAQVTSNVSGPHLTETLPFETYISIQSQQPAQAQSGADILEKYMKPVSQDLDQHDCCICFCPLSEVSSYGDGLDASISVELNKCGHQFHKLCLLEMYKSANQVEYLQCPSCKTIYGQKTGNCPPGTMTWHVTNTVTLKGYEACNTIVVTYNIPPGIQGPDHPNPGQGFSARNFPRQGFIPDCDKGRKVLKLLIEAFKRRLMFTIATSHTTGESNTVTWNEIHHKTESAGNTHGHGYPDPHYLDNVMMELSAHGVTLDSS